MKTQFHSTTLSAVLAMVAGLATGQAQAQYAPYGPAAQMAPAAYGYQPPAGPYGQRDSGSPQRGQAGTRQPYATTTNTQPAYVASRPMYGRNYTALAQVEQIPSPDNNSMPNSEFNSGVGPVEQSGYSPVYPNSPAGGNEFMPSSTPQSYTVPDSNYASPLGGYHSPAGGNGPGCGYGGYGGDEYGLGQYMNCSPGPQWFVGTYAILLERDDSTNVNTSVTVDTNAVAAYPYYPPAMPSAAVLRMNTTEDVDFDWQPGAELRFGSTFGCASLQGCGGSVSGGYGSNCGYGGYGSGACGSGGYGSCDSGGCGCTYQPFAWEFGAWFIGEDDNSILVTDTFSPPTDAIRMYSMINYAGLQYNGRPMNDYTGYAMPIGPDGMAPDLANDIVPVAFRTRTSFSARNLELNFARLPVIGCNSLCGVDCGCGTPAGFSVASLCGVRYLRLDDDFYNDIQFADPAAGGTNYDGFDHASANEIFHQINVDNHLTGFQLGCLMDYTCGCWSWFCNSQFGIFGNHMTQYQRVHSPGGPVSFVSNGANAVVDTKKNDVAFIGELRLGGGYRISQNCRLTAGYRVIALSGVALSVDQLDPFVNPQGVGRIDSQGSLLLHGFQVGSEFNF